jgi:hypothetical protein
MELIMTISKREKSIINIAIMYGLLACVLEPENRILQLIDRMLDYFVLNPGKKEIFKIKTIIQGIEKQFEENNKEVSLTVIFNMLDQILEDEKYYVKYEPKIKAINELQEAILNHPDYNGDYDNLEEAEEVNNLINKFL